MVPVFKFEQVSAIWIFEYLRIFLIADTAVTRNKRETNAAVRNHIVSCLSCSPGQVDRGRHKGQA